MIRAFAEEAFVFFLPFAAFALYLLYIKRNPLAWAAWSDTVVWLTIGGLGLVAAALIFTAVHADREQGAFMPTHVENGQVVPGRFR